MANKKTSVKMKGSTLVEVLIAMVIIVSSISIVMVMGLKITQSSKSYAQLKAELMAHNVLHQTIANQAYFDTSTEEDLFTVNRTIVKGSNSLQIQIHISSLAQKKLVSLTQTIPFDE